MLNITKNVLYLMKVKNWTAADLSEKIHATDRTVKKWLEGSRVPTGPKLDRLAHVAGVSREDFVNKCLDPDSPSEPDDSFSARLVTALKKKDLSIQALARKLSVSSQTIYAWKKGSIPGSGRMKELADYLGVSVEWLAYGEGTGVDDAVVSDVDTLEISALKAKEIPPELIMVQSVKFNPKILMKLCPQADPNQLAVYGVFGDSMTPTLPEGSMALIDLSVTRWEADSLYVVGYGGIVTLKRVQRLPGNIIRLISDNPCYPPFDIDLNDDSVDFKVFGRVIHFWTNGR